MKNQHQVVSVEFQDGRRLFGLWAPWIHTIGTPLFRDFPTAQSHVDCGIARTLDVEKAEQNAEDVVVRMLCDGEPGKVLLTTQASWSEASITGPCQHMSGNYDIERHNGLEFDELAAAYDTLVAACKTAKQALQNVPCVGEAYDQQHSDTHMKASLAIDDALLKAKATK